MRLAWVLLAACHRPLPPPAPASAPPPAIVAVVAPRDAPQVDAEPEPEDAPADEDTSLADSFPIDKQALGPLRIGMTEAQVVKVVGKPKSKSPAEMMGATGDYVGNWDFGDVNLQMSAGKPKGPFRVTAISVAAPSRFKTPEGVGIGATRSELAAVYGTYFGHTNDKNEVLVGSVYFGLLFTLEEERVTGMFLGAMAF